jgi:hypothetical protein
MPAAAAGAPLSAPLLAGRAALAAGRAVVRADGEFHHARRGCERAFRAEAVAAAQAGPAPVEIPCIRDFPRCGPPS